MSERIRLELDAGNSRIKWRLVREHDGGVLDRGVFSWADLSVSAFGFAGVSIARVIYSSVAGTERTERLIDCLSRLVPGVSCVEVKSLPEMAGVVFAYKEVGKLGVDRCLAMVAAWHKYREAVLVIDAGSAITADFVDVRGRHLGGYIFPGAALQKKSLLEGTASVPVAEALGTHIEPGKDTEDCVERAINLMIQSALLRLKELSVGYSVRRLLLCGGSAEWLLKLCGSLEMEYCPELVLEGLSICQAGFGMGDENGASTP